MHTLLFKVMKYGFEKMVGTAQIHAETNKYLVGGVALNDTKINANTMLSVTF